MGCCGESPLRTIRSTTEGQHGTGRVSPAPFFLRLKFDYVIDSLSESPIGGYRVGLSASPMQVRLEDIRLITEPTSRAEYASFKRQPTSLRPGGFTAMNAEQFAEHYWASLHKCLDDPSELQRSKAY